ncbi:hypothetical protein ACQ33O_03800 [Ferruginibacter sp. SUN002]|uniref:hypothetical protein n=1 Tax=Ferruginibacter sp. SUN002 TaxID=2937789 RepID=UPI003D35C440
MKQKSAADLLNEAINETEGRQAYELKLLKAQFKCTAESMKPANLIKSSLHDAVTSPELKNNILSNAVGLATGYLSKKILVGSSHNPIKRLLGTFLQFSIANIVAKKTDNFVTTKESAEAAE